MKHYQKIMSGIAAISVAVTLAACEVKKNKEVKAVKTERVSAAPPAAAKVTVESLDARVSDIERRMALARRQYAKDRAELARRLGGGQ